MSPTSLGNGNNPGILLIPKLEPKLSHPQKNDGSILLTSLMNHSRGRKFLMAPQQMFPQSTTKNAISPPHPFLRKKMANLLSWLLDRSNELVEKVFNIVDLLIHSHHLLSHLILNKTICINKWLVGWSVCWSPVMHKHLSV